MIKLNWIVDTVTEYADNKGQVNVAIKKPGSKAWFRDQLNFTANKGDYEVGDKVEITVTNYTQDKKK